MSSKTKSTAVEITTDHPKDPAWDGVRQTLARVQAAGREYLWGKAWLGWQLFMLKKAHGVREGRPSKNSDRLSEFRSWADIVKDELDLHERTANRLIERFEAVKAKAKRSLKSLPGGKNTLTVFQSENPLALPPEQREAMLNIIASLCDGETEASLMEGLKIIPKPKPMPKPERKDDGANVDPPAGQLAFHFFDAVASPIINARTHPDYKKMLYSLPLNSDEKHPISIAFLKAEYSAALADLEEVEAKAAKPARGRTINA